MAPAQEASGAISDAIAHGRFHFEVRPRYNHIEEGNKPETTEGFTLRAIAGWRSAPWQGLRLTLEGIHTDHLGPKRFNDDPALLQSSPYPLLPDPRKTDFNQAHVEYSGIEGTRIRAGRQVVRLANQRWVSDNDFRQIPQLFDGVTIADSSFERVQLHLGRYWRVRTTSGDTNALALTTAHAALNPAAGHSIGAYGIFHDQAQNGAFTGFADNSYRVLGVRAEGAFRGGESIRIPYLAEAARQRHYSGGDSRIDAPYWRAGLGLEWRATGVRFDYEVKGSNDGLYGVQMPLTDFYAFNGWTLHFFNTPRAGLRDRWLTLRHAIADFVLHAEEHRFRADFGGLDFGSETDVGVSWSFGRGALLRLQHARYDPGSGGIAPRVRKTWLTLTYEH